MSRYVVRPGRLILVTLQTTKIPTCGTVTGIVTGIDRVHLESETWTLTKPWC